MMRRSLINTVYNNRNILIGCVIQLRCLKQQAKPLSNYYYEYKIQIMQIDRQIQKFIILATEQIMHDKPIRTDMCETIGHS